MQGALIPFESMIEKEGKENVVDAPIRLRSSRRHTYLCFDCFQSDAIPTNATRKKVPFRHLLLHDQDGPDDDDDEMTRTDEPFHLMRASKFVRTWNLFEVQSWKYSSITSENLHCLVFLHIFTLSEQRRKERCKWETIVASLPMCIV